MAAKLIFIMVYLVVGKLRCSFCVFVRALSEIDLIDLSENSFVFHDTTASNAFSVPCFKCVRMNRSAEAKKTQKMKSRFEILNPSVRTRRLSTPFAMACNNVRDYSIVERD